MSTLISHAMPDRIQSESARPFKLTPMQAGMLYNNLSRPHTGVDIEQLVCSLPADVSLPLLEQAWKHVAGRHQVLHTAFEWQGLDVPMQLAHPEAGIPVAEEDWRQLSPGECEVRLNEFLAQDRKRGFDLAVPPLMRLSIFRRLDSCTLIWTFHHILLDGRSIRIVLDEVFTAYQALLNGDAPRLGPVARYAEFLEWVSDRPVADAEPFWRDRLAGFTTPTRLAVDARSSSSELSGATYGEHELSLTAGLTLRITEVANQLGVTVNNIVQGAWALLLGKYSGDDEVVFGATRACRHSTVPDSDRTVGLFINTLPVRVPLDGDLEILQWLKDLRQQHVSLRSVEHTPLVDVQRWSNVPAGEPLFETLLVFENSNLEDRLANLDSSPEGGQYRLLERTGFPLTLTAYCASELLLRIQFERERFDDEVVSRMLRHIEQLLKGLVSDPSRRLADVPMVSEAESHRLMVDWNRQGPEPAIDRCIQAFVEDQVASTPDAVAVRCGARHLTYLELNDRANKLAAHLQACGVGPEVRVGVCLQRDLEMVVALLAILKAGGAYVPLDPAYPKDRVAFMLKDSEAAVLITQAALEGSLPSHQSITVFVDRDWPAIESAAAGKPVSTAQPSNLAYVIYTSGSTGVPKGVAIEHRSASTFITWARGVFTPAELAVVLAATSICFDLSVFELFVTLSAGGTVLLVENALGLSTVPADAGVTLINTVPSAMAELLRARAVPESVETVNLAGEPLATELVTAIYDQTCAKRVYDLYGPSEDTTYSTYALRRAGEPATIGRPIAGTQAYVLDRHRQLAPVGVPGELYIGGAGLARGYLNRPELTAERFVANPFPNTPSTRLYRTGDLVRYRSDGNLEYLGRLDHQVKIRGFRIELGEIEARLRSHPAIQDVVVVARELALGDIRLVAYAVAAASCTAPDTSDLRAFVKRELPDFMVPAAFVFLAELPLTPNGKVDRKRLPAPTVSGNPDSASNSAPSNPIEEALVAIWQDVLGVTGIGVGDSFFDLGGHSLMAMRLMDRIQRVFGRKLPLSTLYQSATISTLAAILGQEVGEEGWATVMPIQPREPSHTRPVLFCVASPRANTLGFVFLSRHLGNEQPLYVLQGQYRIEDESPYSLQEYTSMASEYINAMQSIQPAGPYYLTGMCQGAHIAHEMARQLNAAGHQVALLIVLDAWPEENTRIWSLHRLHHYLERLRAYSKLDRSRVTARAKTTTESATSDTGPRSTRTRRGEVWASRYWPGPSFVPPVYGGKVTLFRVARQPYWRIRDPYMGWRDRALGGVEMYDIPGEHTTILREPHVPVLAGLVDRLIESTLSGVGEAAQRDTERRKP